MSSGNSWVGTGYDNSQQSAVPRAQFDLRPLSTGELLDRTFQIYRLRFSLFAGLAVLPAAVNVVAQSLRLWYAAHQSIHAPHGADLYRGQILTASLTLVSVLISLVLYGIVQAATAWAVSAVYLGEAASIKAAFAVAGKHWFRYTLIVLRQLWAGFWLPMSLMIAALTVQLANRRSREAALAAGILVFVTFLSMIYAVWAYIRVSLAVPAAVVESLDVRASIKRSKQLLIDRKVRILLLFLFLFALYLVIAAMQAPLALIALRSRGAQAFLTYTFSLALGFVTGTLVGPIGAIAVCLFYIDERVRREGFDIEWMMSKIAPAAAISAPPSGEISL
ncbi:hypothetical protein HNQ77_002998 [Silvibacterium bohemicum]|uniref:Glycerophosphoryl diester phosphodiesterase membrane domain-containing protein n=1 Tax=Silvibacterium bohemicum TaxID=1577686 RepID=A0A841JUH2_9BACT|nr:hypothetical protein [Silvibacterium bohemicum]MBB6145042.1 hypothetical protein [Silvibacterium bohemicum]